MSENDILKTPFVIDMGFSLPEQEQALWWLVCGEAGCTIMLSSRGEAMPVVLPAGWRGVLVLDQVGVEVMSGSACCQEVRLSVLAKLQAFIDESQNADVFGQAVLHKACLPLGDVSPFVGRRAAEGWLLRLSLAGRDKFFPLISLLRRTECYGLIRFLLAESSGGGKVQDLGERYGVSCSHFRRLCRSALGHAVKTELRDWRMARALLEVASGQKSLTEVALKNGYASSSHFSNEIRVLLGVSPRELSNTMNVAIK